MSRTRSTFLIIPVMRTFVLVPFLGRYKLPFSFGFVILLATIQWLAIRRKKRLLEKESIPYSFFEFWPAWLFYFPVALQYIYLSIRYRSFTLPTAVNPGMKGGAFIGESKSEILNLVPESIKKWVAPHVAFERPANNTPVAKVVQMATDSLKDANIQLPIVAKPDVGQKGFGVRPIRQEDELVEYLRSFPEGAILILQKMVEYENEAGVFYIRQPFEKTGQIFSINFKIFPKLIGDGEHTLRELIMADPRSKRLRHIFLERHKEHLNHIIPKDEPFQLVFSGDHAQGCIFKEGTDRQTPELLSRIHEIAIALPEFYFGRFDIRFRSEEEFLRGEGFQIVEINGAGSEATNIWDPEMDLITAYYTLFRQWSYLFKIGAINRKRGFAPIGFKQLISDVSKYRVLRNQYPSGR